MLTLEGWSQCFACVHSHLEDGGRLVFDIAKWDMALLARDPTQRYPVLRVNHPEHGEIVIEEAASYDRAAQVRHLSWHFSAPGSVDFRVIEYQLRVVFPEELLRLIESSGFRLESRYGEFTRAPFEPSSPRQVCICHAG